MSGAFGAMTGGHGGLRLFKEVRSQSVGDNTTVFKDAFNPFSPTPEGLLPTRPAQRQSTIKVPSTHRPYEWSRLPPHNKRMIRLVTIEKDKKCPPNSTSVSCNLLETTLPTERISCRITEEDLDKLPQNGYEAVSYSWLDMNAGFPLVVNRDEILNVNPSLVACLQQLLRKQDKLTLWWDNICVKQTDKEEIASHVHLMKDIFWRAKRTYMWLGESDSDSIRALQTLNRICGLDGEGYSSSTDRYSKAEQELQRGDLQDPESEISINRLSIARLLNRIYFQRAWIYQEAAASKEIVVLVGDQELNFDRLCDAVEAFCQAECNTIHRTKNSLGNFLQVVAYGYNALLAIRQGRTELRNKRTVSANYLQTLLCRVAGSVKATRDHDLIYAFLGFQDPEHPVPLTVDASSYDTPIGEAYNTAARALMEQTHNLDLLGICGDDGTLKTLASWAPNWKARLPQGQPIYQAGIDRLFHASKALDFHSASGTGAPSQLVTRGRIVDTVTAISGIGFNYADRNNLGVNSFIHLQQHVDFLRGQPNAARREDEDLQQRVLRVLLAEGAFEHVDRHFDGTPTTHTRKFDLPALLEAHNNDSAIRRARGGILGLVPAEQEEAYKTLRRQSLICVRKMMFSSKAGRLGLAPQDVKVGDVVAILNGSRVPLVLRKAKVEGGKIVFCLVGQTYFEGAMYGELTDWESDADADEIILV